MKSLYTTKILNKKRAYDLIIFFQNYGGKGFLIFTADSSRKSSSKMF